MKKIINWITDIPEDDMEMIVSYFVYYIFFPFFFALAVIEMSHKYPLLNMIFVILIVWIFIKYIKDVILGTVRSIPWLINKLSLKNIYSQSKPCSTLVGSFIFFIIGSIIFSLFSTATLMSFLVNLFIAGFIIYIIAIILSLVFHLY